MSRLRPRTVAVVLALAGLVIAGCNTPSNQPGEYDDTTRANFLEGCTGIVTEGTAQDASTSSIGAGAGLATCECRYEYFVQNVPFDSEAAEAAGQGPDAVNFVELNQQVQNDPNSLPPDIRDGLQEACADADAGDGSAPTTSESQTATSAVADPGGVTTSTDP